VSGQCRLTSERLNFFCTTCLIEDSVQTEYDVIRAVATVFSYLCLRRKYFYLLNTEKRPDGIATSSGRIHWCSWILDSSRTLKSIRDVLSWRSNGCNLKLFEASRHFIGERYCHIIWMDVADWWVSRRYTGPFWQKLGIRLLWVGICTESSLNTRILKLVTLILSK